MTSNTIHRSLELLSLYRWQQLRFSLLLLALTGAWHNSHASQEQGPVQPALARVVSATGEVLGTAICVHRDGFFVAPADVAASVNEVFLVPTSNNRNTVRVLATHLASDDKTGLALLKAKCRHTAVKVGAANKILNAETVSILGYSRKNLGEDENELVETTGRFTAAAGVGITLQADVVPGMSGSAIVSQTGQLLGIVIIDDGKLRAVPIEAVSDFVQRPVITCQAPSMNLPQIHWQLPFRVECMDRHLREKPRLELILKVEDGPERRFPIPPSRSGKSIVEAIPVPPQMEIVVTSGDGSIRGRVADRKIKVGGEEVFLSQRLGSGVGIRADGKARLAADSGLTDLPVDLGNVTVVLDLSKATQLELSYTELNDIPSVSYAIAASVGGKELCRLESPLRIVGHYAGEDQPGSRVCHLPSAIADVALAGAGRWLVLHLPETRQLALFDVKTAAIVHSFPMPDEPMLLAGGATKLLIILLKSGRIQRWNLSTLQREAEEDIPLAGEILSVAMGANSQGPLLIHWKSNKDRGGRQCSFLDIESLVVTDIEGNAYAKWHHSVASTNGKLFVAQQYYMEQGWRGIFLEPSQRVVRGSFGRVHRLPGPAGERLFVENQIISAEEQVVSNRPDAEFLLPAVQGDYYLAAIKQDTSFPDQQWSAHHIDDDRQVGGISGFRVSGFQLHPDQLLTLSKRIHFVPSLNSVVMIPIGDKRVVVKRIDIVDRK